jgi:hypothetical protein
MIVIFLKKNQQSIKRIMKIKRYDVQRIITLHLFHQSGQ